jgi:hypothetical protein
MDKPRQSDPRGGVRPDWFELDWRGRASRALRGVAWGHTRAGVVLFLFGLLTGRYAGAWGCVVGLAVAVFCVQSRSRALVHKAYLARLTSRLYAAPRLILDPGYRERRGIVSRFTITEKGEGE